MTQESKEYTNPISIYQAMEEDPSSTLYYALLYLSVLPQYPTDGELSLKHHKTLVVLPMKITNISIIYLVLALVFLWK